MMFARLVVPCSLVAILAVTSCGDDPPADSGTAPAALAVCGNDGVGFLVRSSGGGLLPYGATVLFELGSYVAIDKSCSFAMSGSKGTVLVGTLNDSQAAELSRFLALEEWGSLAPEYSRSCATHVGPTSFRWGDRSLELLPCARLEPPPADFRHELMGFAQELWERLEPWSEPIDGPMRYALVDNDAAYAGIPFSGLYRNAREWPLGEPEDVAVFATADGRAAPVTVAEDEDASSLREIRDAWIDDEIGSEYSLFAPIVGEGGRRYELYIRDVAVGFETDGGLVVPWLTQGRLGITAGLSVDATAVSYSVYCDDEAMPFAMGALAPNPASDLIYWRGVVDDVPGGQCRVELAATGADDSPIVCEAWTAVGTDTPTIRPGWLSSASFRCGP